MNVVDISGIEFDPIYNLVGDRIKSVKFDISSVEIYGEKLQASISNHRLKWDSDIEPDEVFSVHIGIAPSSLNPPIINELCAIEVNCVVTAINKIKCVATDLLYSTGKTFTFNFTSGFVIWFGELGFPISTRPYEYGFIEPSQLKLMSLVEIEVLLSKKEWYRFQLS